MLVRLKKAYMIISIIMVLSLVLSMILPFIRG